MSPPDWRVDQHNWLDQLWDWGGFSRYYTALLMCGSEFHLENKNHCSRTGMRCWGGGGGELSALCPPPPQKKKKKKKKKKERKKEKVLRLIIQAKLFLFFLLLVKVFVFVFICMISCPLLQCWNCWQGQRRKSKLTGPICLGLYWALLIGWNWYVYSFSRFCFAINNKLGILNYAQRDCCDRIFHSNQD